MIGKEDLIRCHIASGDGESVATAYLFDSDYADDEAVALEYMRRCLNCMATLKAIL